MGEGFGSMACLPNPPLWWELACLGICLGSLLRTYRLSEFHLFHTWHQREGSGGKLKPRTWAEHTTRKSCSMNQSEIGGETRKQKDQQASVIETHGDDGPSANLGPWTLVDLT